MTYIAKHGLSRLPCLVCRQFENNNCSCCTVLLRTILGPPISFSSLIGICIVATPSFHGFSSFIGVCLDANAPLYAYNEKAATRPVKRVKSLDRKQRMLRNMKQNENYLGYFIPCINNLN